MSGKTTLVGLMLAASCLGVMASSMVHADEAPADAMRDPIAIYQAAGAGPDQIAKIRELGKGLEDTVRVKWQLMINLQKQMRSLAMEPDPDEKTVLAKQEEINKVGSELGNEKIKTMLQIRSILTPDQRQKLVQLMQEKQQASAAQPAGN